MSNKSMKTPKGKLVEIDGITYQIIEGKLYRYADLTLDKGIKNMHTLLVCPEKFKGTEIEDLYTKSELAKMTIEQRIKHEEGIMTRNDILNSISEQIEEARKEAIEIGIREGIEEGRAEGREEGQAETIRKMLAAGIPASAIAEALEITIEQCESYR